MNWISVKDKVPERGRVVIVTATKSAASTFTSVGEYCYEGCGMLTSADEYQSSFPLFSDYGIAVTHWMPLPEPFNDEMLK